ncbi:MAG: hypothetical protein ACR2FU_20855 [Streptosporangiaceae bacterium]
MTWIEVRLTAEARGWTRFELEHVGPADDQRWAEFGPGATGVGWDMTLLGLARYLHGGSAPAGQQAAAAWMSSAGGRDFMTLSSQRWRDADIAAGTDEAAARAAAGRCTAAYTGGSS